MAVFQGALRCCSSLPHSNPPGVVHSSHFPAAAAEAEFVQDLSCMRLAQNCLLPGVIPVLGPLCAEPGSLARNRKHAAAVCALFGGLHHPQTLGVLEVLKATFCRVQHCHGVCARCCDRRGSSLCYYQRIPEVHLQL